MNRFQFVEDHKDAYGVKRLCEVIEIARSSFYAWLAAAPGRAARAADDARLAARIRVLQDPAQGGDRAYGAPRITADLNDGVPAAGRVNHKRVARVMREHALAGIRLRRRVKTTIPCRRRVNTDPVASGNLDPLRALLEGDQLGRLGRDSSIASGGERADQGHRATARDRAKHGPRGARV